MRHINAVHRRLMQSVRWNWNAGVEFTTVPPCAQGEGEDDWYWTGIFQRRMRRWRARYIPRNQRSLIERIGTDPGCYEIPSTILHSWSQLNRFYRVCKRAADMGGCVPYNENTTGGGGHIHLSRSDTSYDEEKLAATTLNYVTNNPWIAWAFNDPSDNETAMCGVYFISGWYSNLREAYVPPMYNVRVKDYAVALNQGIELRFFNAAVDDNEQVRHMAFAQRLMSHCLSLPQIGPSGCRRHPPRITLSKALDGWKRTIAELGLPWSLYKGYTKNIRERYALGRSYLN